MQEDVVLCKIYRKATSLKILEHKAAMEDIISKTLEPSLSSTRPQEGIPKENLAKSLAQNQSMTNLPLTKQEDDDLFVLNSPVKFGCLKYCNDSKELRALDVPKLSMDETADAFWTPMRSLWLENCSLDAFASLLNC